MLSGPGFSLVKEDTVSEHLGKAGDKEEHAGEGFRLSVCHLSEITSLLIF